jgi:hypothetical protein
VTDADRFPGPDAPGTHRPVPIAPDTFAESPLKAK